MAQYRPIAGLPPASDGYPYARRLALAHADGAVVWQTAAAEIVESRDVWPDGTAGLSATPADPEAAGWTRLTPAPT